MLFHGISVFDQTLKRTFPSGEMESDVRHKPIIHNFDEFECKGYRCLSPLIAGYVAVVAGLIDIV